MFRIETTWRLRENVVSVLFRHKMHVEYLYGPCWRFLLHCCLLKTLDITLKTSHLGRPETQQWCPWKLGSSCGKHTGQHLWCSVILVKLLHKFISTLCLCKKAPSHNRVARKFSTNGRLCTFSDASPRNQKWRSFFHEGTGWISLHFTQCDNSLYISHKLNQSSSISLGSSQWFFVTFSIVRFVIAK